MTHTLYRSALRPASHPLPRDLTRRLGSLLAAAVIVSTFGSVGAAPAAAAELPAAATMSRLPAWLEARGRDSIPLTTADNDRSSVVARIPRETVLRVLSGGQQRIQVELPATGGQPARSGWVTPEDVQPATGPGTAAKPLLPPANPFPTREAFLTQVGTAAQLAQAATGVPASVTLAQAILESSWGESLLSRQANNYFGMKAIGKLGNDGVEWMRTTEVDENGETYSILAPFRAYKTIMDSLVDHDLLFMTTPRYAAAMAVKNDARAFARKIAEGGYATDPEYADKLIKLISSFYLDRFDVPLPKTSVESLLPQKLNAAPVPTSTAVPTQVPSPSPSPTAAATQPPAPPATAPATSVPATPTQAPPTATTTATAPPAATASPTPNATATPDAATREAVANIQKSPSIFRVLLDRLTSF